MILCKQGLVFYMFLGSNGADFNNPLSIFLPALFGTRALLRSLGRFRTVYVKWWDKELEESMSTI